MLFIFLNQKFINIIDMESLLEKIDKYLYTSDKNERISRDIVKELKRQKNVQDLSEDDKQILIDGGILKNDS